MLKPITSPGRALCRCLALRPGRLCNPLGQPIEHRIGLDMRWTIRWHLRPAFLPHADTSPGELPIGGILVIDRRAVETGRCLDFKRAAESMPPGIPEPLPAGPDRYRGCRCGHAPNSAGDRPGGCRPSKKR